MVGTPTLAGLWARHLASPRPRAWLGPFGGRHLRACRPVERLELRGPMEKPELWWWKEGRSRRLDADPLEFLEERIRFRGLAATGFLAYEFAHRLERFPANAGPPSTWPLLQFTLHGEEERLEAGHAPPRWPDPALPTPPPAILLPEAPPTAFRRGAGRIREWIRAGDCYQVNLVQGFQCRWPVAGAPWLFAALRAGQAPEGYRALLEERGRALVCDSPELFLERRGDRLRTQPIKGTMARIGPDWRDAARALADSSKDRAELAMIVDLLRNDLSRVCRPGSVEVGSWPEWLVLPHLVHSAATITGRPREGAGLKAVLAATFPCGSVTGCPRLRAMERIAQLEPGARGPCFGAVGRLEPDGDFTLAVAIRTALLQGGALRLLAGGGITLDSRPAAEEAESRLKVERFRRVLAGQRAG